MLKCDYKIYSISESDTPDNIRYIGSTTLTLKQRLKQHLKDSKRILCSTQKYKDKSYKAKWIRKCLKENKNLLIVLVDFLDHYDENLEIQWIKKYRDEGYKLTNISDGGKAFFYGKHHSEKSKKRISKFMSNRKISEETANKTRGSNNGYATAVIQFDKVGNFIKKYGCINDAYKEIRAPKNCRNITTCATKNKFNNKHKRYSSMGFVWEYEKP